MQAATSVLEVAWSDLTSMGIPPAEKVVRTVLVYLGIVVVIRVAGKRLMNQMNSLDLVVVLLLSNVVQNAIIGDDNSLTGGLLGAMVLVAVNAGMDRLVNHSRALTWWVEGKPTTVVTAGEVDAGALHKLGMTRAELDNALRHQGADDLHDVDTATISPGGTVTVNLTRAAQSASYEDLRRAVEELSALIRHESPDKPSR